MAKAILIAEENEAKAVAVLNALNTAQANNPFQGAENSASIPRREHAALASRERPALPEILLLNFNRSRSEGFPVMEWVRAQSHLF